MKETFLNFTQSFHIESISAEKLTELAKSADSVESLKGGIEGLKQNISADLDLLKM